jgi:SAM-dependent methyltransferase
MLDLIRLSPRRLFPPGGEELYRQIARLTRIEADSEVLVVGCANGVTAGYLASDWGARVSGVDADPDLLERGEAWVRGAGLQHRLSLQTATADALPYRDRIFDVVVGELTLASEVDAGAAVRELVRVLRPGGRIALVQLVWKAPVEPARRELLAGQLGVRPFMLVEWKRLLREAGIRHLHTEDWSDDEAAFRPVGIKPFPDFAEIFSVPEKLSILRRAWGRWGWEGVRAALSREVEVHHLLTRERILGLDLLVGRLGEVEAAPTREAPAPRDLPAPGEPPAPGDSPPPGDASPQLRDLPLFTSPDDAP